VLGSAHYIAPELVRGGMAEEHSDVYSLGCLMYEMVTGRPPFFGELDVALLHQHVSARPRRARALVPDIPRALDQLVMQTLAKRAADRPAAAELGPLLERLAGATAVEISSVTAARASPRATKQLPGLEPARPRHRHRLLLVAVVMTLVVTVGLAIAGPGQRSGRAASENDARAASLHGAASSRAQRQSWHLPPIAAGAVRGVAGMVMTAVAGLEAARAPAPAVPSPGKPAAKRNAHPPRTRVKRNHRHGQPEPSGKEREAVSPHAGDETESPAAVSEAEAPPAEAPVPESPPPATTSTPGA
jgi:hypothetical protein